jgi:HlyD family secretion protein
VRGTEGGDRATWARLGCILAVPILLVSCSRPDRNSVQGYVEGEFVYIASPLAGALESLDVERGASVKAGDPLFSLESIAEKAVRDEAERRLAQARATLEDARKGKRPSEIASIEAQLKQAREALTLSERELARLEPLLRDAAVAVVDYDRARSTRDQDRQRVARLEAELQTARLGSRSDQIAAAEAYVRGQEAALTKAEWELSQKRQVAPQAGVVFDRFYREGEWVAAGRPVVALLPPQNIKVRAFVPEPQLSAVHQGDRIGVSVDGQRDPFIGTVSFISPRAEFTPPVIYSQESRGKLVFMIEAVFDSQTAANLHPGQPVDVHLGVNHR